MFFGWDILSIASDPDDYIPLPALEGPDGIVNAVRQSGSAEMEVFKQDVVLLPVHV